MPKLNAISPSDPISRLALKGIMKNAPILMDAEFFTRTGPSDVIKREPESSDTALFRSINEDNSPTPGARNYDTYAKKILSYDAKVDVILEDRNEDVTAELATQLLKESENRGFILQEKFFEGDDGSDPEEFDGFRNIVQTIYDHGDSDILLPLGNSDTNKALMQAAYEQFQKDARKVPGGATHAYMNGTLKIRWLSIAKELGYYRMSKDELGSTIEMIGNIIIRDAGLKKNGDDILPFSETVGGNTTTSSVFFCRWGNRSDLSVLTSRGLVGRDAGQIGNFYINNVNMDAVLTLQNYNALVQSKGWALEETAGS